MAERYGVRCCGTMYLGQTLPFTCPTCNKTFPHAAVRPSLLLASELCPCGLFLQPELVNITSFGQEPQWMLTWKCANEMQHEWAANNA